MLIEPGQALGGLEGLLDGPTTARDRHQSAQRGHGRAVATVVSQFAVAGVPADEQPLTTGACGGGVWPAQSDPGPVVETIALGSWAGAEPLPGLFGQAGGDLVGAARSGTGRDSTITADGQHITELAGF